MKAFWTIVVLIIILGGIWYFTRDNAQAPTGDEAAGDVQGIMMEDGTATEGDAMMEEGDAAGGIMLEGEASVEVGADAAAQ